MACHVFQNADAVAAELVLRTAAAAEQAIAARGRFIIALTGGSAAKQLYPVLAQAPLPWAQTHVVFGDERCVAPGDPDSNFRLARETLLDRAAIPASNVHRIRGEDDPVLAARAYEAELSALCGGVIDVIHLGVGPDGHVCSLFPGHALLNEAVRGVASLIDAPKQPAARVTLTMPTLRSARALWFLVLGDAKAEAVRSALLDPASPLPAAVAARDHHDALWLCDEPAARHLKSG